MITNVITEEDRKRKNREKQKRYRERHPERVKANHRRSRLKQTFGITPEDYERMLAEQNGLCAICSNTCRYRLAVDHCHKTGQVRGLLCEKCNKGIGLLGDDETGIRAALDYLVERKTSIIGTMA